GSDRILRTMRRGYTAGDYKSRLERIKTASRRLALTSDIIVGFPGETEADFEETLKLVRHCEFDSLYIFKYSKRAGTPAANLNDSVPEQVKSERFLRLEKAQRETQNRTFQNYVGRTLSVLAERLSTRSAADLVGHSTCHKVVNFPGEVSLEGQILNVRITAAKTNSLYGQRVQSVCQ
ncbi:MAG TPA: TRAM domain-containing protein, partial [Pyrinomonadaceae bacterium]